MNQTCKVCGEPAAGFHFGAFTCEGCKSFFGRSYNNLSSISECKNNGKCIIDKKNRTTCKACRLRKCYTVGMSKGGSRYGRRSNWFKIHCLLQEQQQQAVDAASMGGGSPGGGASVTGFSDMAAAAAQHMQQQRNSLAMGGLLGYPGYLPAEMMQTASSFAGQRHPADVAAAASLPFFSMMNSLPHSMGGSAPPAFQLPPHLLFSGYHHPSLAAESAYRAEMFKHRQSVDSAASAESQRYSPATRSPYNSVAEEENNRVPSNAPDITTTTPPREMTPELCVSGDTEEHTSTTLSHHSMSPVSTISHPIHSPIAIRATLSPVAPIAIVVPNISEPTTVPSKGSSVFLNADLPAAASTLSFVAKMQSLSPVSVCSISAETTAAQVATSASSDLTDQDCPMDLSMKTSISSVSSFESESSIEEREELRRTPSDSRRKYYLLSSEQESDDACSTSTSTSDSQVEEVKRQKLAADDASTTAASTNYGGFAQHTSATSMRVFVCV